MGVAHLAAGDQAAPHLHSIVPDGLLVADSLRDGDPGGCLRFEPLPPPTTADVEELNATIARRLMDRVAAAWEADGNSYLDPELAALCEAFFFSRSPPTGKRDIPFLPGMDATDPQGKPFCASVEGFSLHAAQSVAAEDRKGLERLLRYGLRAPFSQERLSLRPDGKVVYRLRRPWPNVQGATHLILDPLKGCGRQDDHSLAPAGSVAGQQLLLQQMAAFLDPTLERTPSDESGATNYSPGDQPK